MNVRKFNNSKKKIKADTCRNGKFTDAWSRICNLIKRKVVFNLSCDLRGLSIGLNLISIELLVYILQKIKI